MCFRSCNRIDYVDMCDMITVVCVDIKVIMKQCLNVRWSDVA